MEKPWKQNLHLLSQLTADFFKHKTGKGPKDIKAYLIENKILIEMSNLLTPIEREIATTTDGIMNVKFSREQFYKKLTQDYHALAGKILECRIEHSCSVCDISTDKIYIVLTLGNS